MKYRITKTDIMGKYTSTITFEAPTRSTVEEQLVWWEKQRHGDDLAPPREASPSEGTP